MNGILGNLAMNGRQMFTLNATHRILTGRNHNLTCTSCIPTTTKNLFYKPRLISQYVLSI